ncbi:TPA: hypothetical protein PC505_003958 [Morganella morganii]|nr:hypothetical protein [Morganella morganii]HDF2424503.1 hypothetical protein [Morganella morganii]HED3891536.1 hypothetical protein [Morganella morganii]
MKKLFAFVLSVVVLLSGCGDDNGELAGVYKKPESNSKMVLTFKDKDYEVQYFYNENSTPTLVGFAKKDGNFLVGENNKKMFEISGDEITTLYSPKKSTFKKIE